MFVFSHKCMHTTLIIRHTSPERGTQKHTYTDKETHKLHVCTLSINKLEEDDDDDDHFQ